MPKDLIVLTSCSGVKSDMRYADIQLDDCASPHESVTVLPISLSGTLWLSLGVHSFPFPSMSVTGT